MNGDGAATTSSRRRDGSRRRANARQGEWTFHAADWNQKPIAAAGLTARPAPAQFGFMCALDVNGDGRRDIVTAMGHDYGVCWFEQNAGRHVDPRA